jgi:hypothetical protein
MPPRRCWRRGCRRSKGSGKSRSAAARFPQCGLSSIRRRCSNTVLGSRISVPPSRPPTPTARRREIETGDRHYQFYDNDAAAVAAGYQSLIIAQATSAMSSTQVEDIRTAGLANGKPAVLIIVNRVPGRRTAWSISGPRRERVRASPKDRGHLRARRQLSGSDAIVRQRYLGVGQDTKASRSKRSE